MDSITGSMDMSLRELWEMVKNLPVVWEIWVLSLGWKDPLEKEMAIHSSTIIVWKIHEQRSLVGYSPCGHKESDMTEQVTNSND